MYQGGSDSSGLMGFVIEVTKFPLKSNAFNDLSQLEK